MSKFTGDVNIPPYPTQTPKFTKNTWCEQVPPPTPKPKKQKKGFRDQLPGAALGPNIVCHVTRTHALTPRSSPPPYTNIRACVTLEIPDADYTKRCWWTCCPESASQTSHLSPTRQTSLRKNTQQRSPPLEEILLHQKKLITNLPYSRSSIHRNGGWILPRSSSAEMLTSTYKSSITSKTPHRTDHQTAWWPAECRRLLK